MDLNDMVIAGWVWEGARAAEERAQEDTDDYGPDLDSEDEAAFCRRMRAEFGPLDTDE